VAPLPKMRIPPFSLAAWMRNYSSFPAIAREDRPKLEGMSFPQEGVGPNKVWQSELSRFHSKQSLSDMPSRHSHHFSSGNSASFSTPSGILEPGGLTRRTPFEQTAFGGEDSSMQFYLCRSVGLAQSLLVIGSYDLNAPSCASITPSLPTENITSRR